MLCVFRFVLASTSTGVMLVVYGVVLGCSMGAFGLAGLTCCLGDPGGLI